VPALQAGAIVAGRSLRLHRVCGATRWGVNPAWLRGLYAFAVRRRWRSNFDVPLDEAMKRISWPVELKYYEAAWTSDSARNPAESFRLLFQGLIRA